jgi:TolB-like protein
MLLEDGGVGTQDIASIVAADEGVRPQRAGNGREEYGVVYVLEGSVRGAWRDIEMNTRREGRSSQSKV